jgi:hypothetical protein
MYLDSSPVIARRSETPRRRGTRRKPVRQTRRPDNAAARRTRVDDAIVAQWLLDQLPTERRHMFGSATHR